MSAFTPFYRGFILVGNAPVPVLPNASFSCPQNWALPPTVGNMWQYDYGQGLRQPVIDISLVVRDNYSVATGSTEALAASFFANFLTRTPDNSYDSIYIGAGGGPPPPIGAAPGGSYGTLDVTDGITFWDGASGFQMTGAKAASFTISTSKGDDLRFTCRFMGTGIHPIAQTGVGTNLFKVTDGSLTGSTTANTAISAAYNQPTNAFNVLRFKSLLLGSYANSTFTPFGGTDGLRSGGAYNISLTYNNNLTPDLGLNGTEFPSGLNAGQQTVSLNYTLQANDTAFLDNYASTANAPLAIGIAKMKLSPTFAQSDIRRVIVLNNLLDNTPNEQAMSAPRVMRQHSLIGLGSTANSTANPAVTGPIVVI